MFTIYNVYQKLRNAKPAPTAALRKLESFKSIGLEAPILRDQWLNEELHATIESLYVFQCPKLKPSRDEVLGKLEVLARRWIRDTAIEKQTGAEVLDQLGGKIYAFGLYCFEALAKDAYMDALCVAPSVAESKDFTVGLYKLLKKQQDVTQSWLIEKAGVPIIKMSFCGIKINLHFARLSLRVIPDDLVLNDDFLLRNIDDRSLQSLNDCLATEAILDAVPNKEKFGLALRAIILWAKRRGIYSDSLGYFGGMTWALLVAHTYQLYRSAPAATLVKKVFLVILMWEWPHPLQLEQLKSNNLNFKAWEPTTSIAHQAHLMPVLTPGYPQRNTVSNMTASTRKIIIDEVNLAQEVTAQITKGEAVWDRFFAPTEFFYKYQHFIVLLAHSDTEDDHMAWVGLVQSRVHLLVEYFERSPHITNAHVNPRKFAFKRDEKTAASNIRSPYCAMWFIGVTIKQADCNLEIISSINDFSANVVGYAIQTRLFKQGMHVDKRYVKRANLCKYLSMDLLERDCDDTEFSVGRSIKRHSTNLQNFEEVTTDGLRAKRVRLSD